MSVLDGASLVYAHASRQMYRARIALGRRCSPLSRVFGLRLGMRRVARCSSKFQAERDVQCRRGQPQLIHLGEDGFKLGDNLSDGRGMMSGYPICTALSIAGSKSVQRTRSQSHPAADSGVLAPLLRTPPEKGRQRDSLTMSSSKWDGRASELDCNGATGQETVAVCQLRGIHTVLVRRFKVSHRLRQIDGNRGRVPVKNWALWGHDRTPHYPCR